MNELISVIVPVYKVEQYLDRCVQSIFKQTYQNFEIILVDDGSPDGCPALCDEYARRDPRIKVIHQANAGLSAARNTGIRNCSGAYCVFVDSDDSVAPQYLDVLYDLVRRYDVDIACVGYQEFDDTGFLPPKYPACETETVYAKEDALRGLFREDLYKDYAWNKIYRRTLFDSVRFPEGRKMEDLGTTYRLFDLCDKIVYSGKPLYFYYQRETSILHDPTLSLQTDLFDLSRERFFYLTEKYPEMEENRSAYYTRLILYTKHLDTKCLDKARRITLTRDLMMLLGEDPKSLPFSARLKYFLLIHAPAGYSKLKRILHR